MPDMQTKMGKKTKGAYIKKTNIKKKTTTNLRMFFWLTLNESCPLCWVSNALDNQPVKLHLSIVLLCTLSASLAPLAKHSCTDPFPPRT